MKEHPLASIWPLMSDAELDRLAEDIKEHGQRLPIIRVDGMILDGRNRWLACERAGLGPWVQDIPNDEIEVLDALAWSLNNHRRHADEGVRAIAAARRANMKRGDNQHTAIAVTSQAEAARQFGVSVDTLQRAKTVLDHGEPALITAVESGHVAVSLAAKAVRHYRETGEPIVSIADLKETMRRIYREEHPLPEPEPVRALKEPAAPPPDHIGVDTFGIVTAITRHAEQYSVDDAAERIDKWTRLNILDHLPPAIDYLTELEKRLNGGN